MTSLDAELPRPGDVVAGKYRIDGLVGAGGMGVVMGAYDASLGRQVAIKFLAPEKARRPGATQRFVREARAAASIQSEHVVRVFEVGTLPSGSPFIVMEQLHGADLSKVLASRGPLPIEEAVDDLLQVCEALAEAHARGIVHRDLKPQNLFLTTRPDGSPAVKVLDFGISKAIDEQAPNLTATDTVMGTPLYMSPEQVRSLKNVDHRSDVWALGSILFELLTCSPIYDAPSASALCAMIAMDPPTPLRAKRPAAPPALEAAILRCLHKDPQGRYPDVGALAEALSPFATERGRASAARAARIAGASPWARGATSGPAHATAIDPMAPTSDVLAMPAGSVPPRHAPTTQQTWQRATSAPRRSSAVLVALLAAGAGVLVLAVGGAGAWWLVSRRDAPPTSAEAPVATSAAVATSAPPASPTPPPSAAPAASPSPTPPTPASPSLHPIGRDAGAKPPPSPRDDDLEAKKRQAEAMCNHHRFLLGQNDPKNNDQAKMVRTMVCLRASSLSPNSGAATCDRVNCRSACSMLNDQDCIRRLDFAEKNAPLKY